MSNIDKQALRKRYSAKPTPKCDICGAKMTIQRMSGSRVTCGCSGAIYDETGCHYAEGRSLADDHYEQSRVTVTDESDPDVLALLDELEAVQKTSAARLGAIDTTHKMFQRERDRSEAAERRIAELEEREVRLTDINDYLAEVHDKTLNRAFRLLAEGVRAGDVAAMRAAGINVAAAGKGE